MENNDNNEIIVKKKTSEAMKASQKRFYKKNVKMKNFKNEEEHIPKNIMIIIKRKL